MTRHSPFPAAYLKPAKALAKALGLRMVKDPVGYMRIVRTWVGQCPTCRGVVREGNGQYVGVGLTMTVTRTGGFEFECRSCDKAGRTAYKKTIRDHLDRIIRETNSPAGSSAAGDTATRGGLAALVSTRVAAPLSPADLLPAGEAVPPSVSFSVPTRAEAR